MRPPSLPPFAPLLRCRLTWNTALTVSSLLHAVNWWAGYDWVFLNDQPFSAEFKK